MASPRAVAVSVEIRTKILVSGVLLSDVQLVVRQNFLRTYRSQLPGEVWLSQPICQITRLSSLHRPHSPPSFGETLRTGTILLSDRIIRASLCQIFPLRSSAYHRVTGVRRCCHAIFVLKTNSLPQIALQR